MHNVYVPIDAIDSAIRPTHDRCARRMHAILTRYVYCNGNCYSTFIIDLSKLELHARLVSTLPSNTMVDVIHVRMFVVPTVLYVSWAHIDDPNVDAPNSAVSPTITYVQRTVQRKSALLSWHQSHVFAAIKMSVLCA